MESMPEGLLAAWESALLKTTGATIVVSVEGEEEKATLLLGEGDRVRWTFGVKDLRMHLVSDGGKFFLQVPGKGKRKGMSSPVVRNNLLVGFARMGIEGTRDACMSVLLGDPDIDPLDSRITIDRYTERPKQEKRIEVSYEVRRWHFWSYRVRMEFDTEAVIPRVREIKHGLTGYTSTERFAEHRLGVPWAGDDFCLEE